ncbi:EF-hand domain pair domain-containing protein [Ditylenchus destructor]|uniref:EF-hand domain pair domain-containing protein n=1 Tax=Ditylenchus destructor TaxID=166010 RepID=A0AAD4NAE2_9BILA|nr:EF-hand domain pair domain-containing protein [Ditylenchus destructor]
MGNSTTSLMLQEDEISQIVTETGFSRNQIVRLYSRFLSLDRQGRGYLDREDFLRIPELAINPLGDRIVDAFFTERYLIVIMLDSIADCTITEADADKDGKISFEEFCKAMERTDIDQKMSIRFLN